MKSAAAIVPPGKFLGVGVAMSKQIGQTFVHEVLQVLALRLGIENGAVPGLAAPTIEGSGNDIKIAADQVFSAGVLLPIASETFIPIELTSEISVFEGFAIWTIYSCEIEGVAFRVVIPQ